MPTLREQLEKLLIENENIMDGQSSDALYQEWAELALAVSKTMDGFVKVLETAKACRDAQKSFFLAKKAGYVIAANKHLSESKTLEKETDKLLAQWSAQMLPLPPSTQTSLFE